MKKKKIVFIVFLLIITVVFAMVTLFKIRETNIEDSIDSVTSQKDDSVETYSFLDDKNEKYTITIKKDDDSKSIYTNDVNDVETSTEAVAVDNNTEEEKPNENIVEEKIEPTSDTLLRFDEYLKLSEDEKYIYYLSFDSYEDFCSWYETEENEYKNKHKSIIVEDGKVIEINKY